jgi:hypothetical protein
VLPLQQPLHDTPSQWQTPATHRWPVAHAPAGHTLPQPSLAPQALPAQLGVHDPALQTLGAPPPPQTCPAEQLPQSTIAPHAS